MWYQFYSSKHKKINTTNANNQCFKIQLYISALFLYLKSVIVSHNKLYGVNQKMFILLSHLKSLVLKVINLNPGSSNNINLLGKVIYLFSNLM